MHPAIPSTLRLLLLPCPPMLAEVVGYRGESRFVGLFWSPTGDEAVYDDGFGSGTGERSGYLAFVHHPFVRRRLADVDLGSSDREGSHWLLADLVEFRLYMGLVSEVRSFLRAANTPAPETPIATTDTPVARAEDLIEELRTGGFIEQFEEVPLDSEQLRRRVAARLGRQDRLVASLTGWLDRLARARAGG